jgi:MGT family glycosyltransferase
MARFLFVTTPVTGHVSPLLPVAKKLVERVHEVQWYTSTRFQQPIQAVGATFIPYHAARDMDFHRADELYPERAQLKGIAQFKWDMRLTIDIAAEQVEDLSRILAEFAADIIVGDSIAISALFIAEKMNLPLALVNVINLFAISKDTAADGFALAPSSTALGRVRNHFLNWLVFRFILRDINEYLTQTRAKLDLSAIRETFFESLILRSDLFLQPTVPAFEYPRSDLPGHVHFIGALLPDGPTEFTKPGWWDDLKSDRPVVLVTQGTIATDFDDLLIPAIRGLADENVLVVATTGNKPIDHISLDSPPSNLHLEPFVPFSQLMPHVDVMVTNGGYGGTNFALAHGVPLVAAGKTEDKAEICARVAWSGVGINLKTNKPTPEQIRGAVRTVLANPQYKDKVQAMQAEFARHDAPVQAAELLEKLAATKR